MHITPTFLCRIGSLPPVPQYLGSLGVTKVQNSDITVVEALILGRRPTCPPFPIWLLWGGLGSSIYIIGKQIK